MSQNCWKVRNINSEDKRIIETLSKELGVDSVVATLLCMRGIKDYHEAKKFFRPQLSDLYDPFLMKDMDKAVERLEQAIVKKEKILIYGDYDVDGTTATAMMVRFLRSQNADVEFYIPNRYAEGYGLSEKGINTAIEKKINLLIAVDCGIKGNKLIKRAKDNGIDVIVCDHHEQGEELPVAYALLDPKRNDCNYPFKELSGCGVAYKLLQAYTKKHNIPAEEIEKYLDLVAVSISSDIVPIIDENRTLAYHGLMKLIDSPCVGLESIKELTELTMKDDIQINDIVFKIGPRINAAGRIDDARTAVELLLTEDSDFAMSICRNIDNMNTYRKKLDSDYTAEAIEQIKNDERLLNSYATIVYDENWNKGIVGIVASRLIETFYRPTIVFTKVVSAGKELIAGSARSVEGFDLYKAVTACGDLLESYGGHTFAAGLTMKVENFEAFKQRFEEYVKNNITEEQRQPVINIDMEIPMKDITPKLNRILKQMAPFGPGNMTPIFSTKHVYDNGLGRIIGKTGEHLKLKLVEELGDNNCIDGVGFGFGKDFKTISNFKPFDICYHITENFFMNRTTLQVQVLDIKASE